VRANFDEPWQVYLVSSNGGVPRLLLADNFILGQSEPSWSPDGTTLAIEISSGIARVRTSDGQLLVHGTGRGFDPDWSPDGRSLVFHNARIYIANADSGPVRQLVPDAIAPQLPNYMDREVAWLRSNK